MFNPRKLLAEFLGTAILVFIAVGAATLSFGFHLAGLSFAAGIVMTALAFGLVLVALVYAIGPISGCHINPAVTIGFVASGRMKIQEAIGYWIAQILGGIAGAYLWWCCSPPPRSPERQWLVWRLGWRCSLSTLLVLP